MTESELIEIVFLSISAAEAQFEFWMAVTIALVVAAHTAGDSLLYLMACVLFYLRYDAAVTTLLSHMQQLRDIESDFGVNQILLLRAIRSIVVVGTSSLAVALIVNLRLGSKRGDDT